MKFRYSIVEGTTPVWGEVAFNPGAEYFTVTISDPDFAEPVSTSKYYLTDNWFARGGDALAAWLDQLAGGDGDIVAGDVNFAYDEVTPFGEFPLAVQDFFAQPRIKDPFKGCKAEDMLGPYTNVADIADVIAWPASGDLAGTDNLSVYPRAVILNAGVDGAYKLYAGPDSSPLAFGSLPTGTILPIRVWSVDLNGDSPSVGALTVLW